MDAVFVRPVPVDILAVAVPSWDAESSTVSCSVCYSPMQLSESPTPLRDSLDQRFGLAPKAWLIIAGELTLSLDSERKLVALDFYTNAGKWIVDSLEPVKGVSSAAYLTATFDELGRASGFAEPVAIYDPTRGTLCLSWGSVDLWWTIAPTLSIGQARDGRLMQIRIGGLFVPEEDRREPDPSGGWRAVARRLLGGS